MKTTTAKLNTALSCIVFSILVTFSSFETYAQEKSVTNDAKETLTKKEADKQHSDPKANPFSLDIKESRQIEKRADRINTLRKMYSENAVNGSVVFGDTYLIEKPITLRETVDFEHPALKTKLSQLDEKERDEILEAVEEEAAKQDRYKSIMNEGAKFGMSAGMHSTAMYLYDLYKNVYYDSLAQVFPYYILMLENGKIKPALIDEVGHQQTKTDKRTLSSIKRRFRIAEQAEVVLKPPTYINFFENLLLIPKPKVPSVYYMPINEEELVYWKKGVLNGWVEGDKQAHNIVRENVILMERAMYGYLRFHALADRGTISMPTSHNILVGTNSRGDVVNIGESVFEITELPSLNDDEQDWIALPQMEDIFGELNDAEVDRLTAEIEELGSF